MDILNNNRELLANLYEQYPLSFDGLRIEGNNLCLGKESCDISKFNIYDLIDGNSNFLANLNGMTAEDVFRIIRLHTLTLESSFAKDKNAEKLEYIKQDNPQLQNITIIPKNERTGKEEIIVIVDSTGRDKVFVNTYGIDFFDVYAAVKDQVGSREVTPEDLIREIDKRIYEIDLTSETEIKNTNRHSEDFQNKITRTGEPYNDSSSINVYGNEENDIAIVADSRDASNHQVVTFNQDEFGNTYMDKHESNVSVEEGNVEKDLNDKDNKIEAKVEEKKEEDVLPLISEREFYELLQRDDELSDKERKDLATFYAFLGDLIIYEDYLLPDLTEVLNNFRLYVLNCTNAINEGSIQPTKYQVECVNKLEELEQKAVEQQEKDRVIDDEPNFPDFKKDANGKVLRLEHSYQNAGSSNSGFGSVLFVVAVVVIVAIIMTIVTLYLVK